MHVKQILISIAVLFLIGIGLWQSSSILSWMKYHHLLPEPEPLTELYFENHLSLPAILEIGKSQTFTFTIHNIEYRTVEYGVEINATTNPKSQIPISNGEKGKTENINDENETPELLQSLTMRLEHDQYHTATVSYTLKSNWPKERTRVEVAIVKKVPLTPLYIARPFDDSRQAIHFWLEQGQVAR